MIKQEDDHHDDIKLIDNLIQNTSDQKVQHFIDGLLDKIPAEGNNLMPSAGDVSGNMNVAQMIGMQADAKKKVEQMAGGNLNPMMESQIMNQQMMGKNINMHTMQSQMAQD
jgi:hypothetical protein